MIKFFRRIRQKLLSENRFSKYLLYAIGEIILVVIGILIALQINTWNEDRKDIALRKKYSMGLLNELKADTELINEHLTRVRRDSARVAKFEIRLQSDGATYDTIAHIFRYEFYPLVTPITLNGSTLNTLVATGDIGLYPDTIRASLMTFSHRQALAMQNNAIDVEKYLTLLNDITKEFPLENYFVDLHPKFRDDIWNKADQTKMAGSLDLALDWKKVYNLNEVRSFSQLLVDIESIITSIKKIETIE